MVKFLVVFDVSVSKISYFLTEMFIEYVFLENLEFLFSSTKLQLKFHFLDFTPIIVYNTTEALKSWATKDLSKLENKSISRNWRWQKVCSLYLIVYNKNLHHSSEEKENREPKVRV